MATDPTTFDVDAWMDACRVVRRSDRRRAKQLAGGSGRRPIRRLSVIDWPRGEPDDDLAFEGEWVKGPDGILRGV